MLLRGSFSKRSMGQRVNGSNAARIIVRLYMIADNARLTPPRCKKHTGSTGRQVNGSTGQRVKQVDGSTGHFHFHYIIYESRQRQAHATLLQKAHSVFLLARRVNFLVTQKLLADFDEIFSIDHVADVHFCLSVGEITAKVVDGF